MGNRAVSESRGLRYATLSTLYATQGIPDAMVLIVFPAYLAANGVGIAAIGAFLATAMLPNGAKLLAGPMIDRLAYLPMGRRKPWILFGQTGIAASFFFTATLGDPIARLPLFTAAAFMVTLATAFQDIATDGMAMDVVPPDEQGRANGVMWGSKTVGTAIAASGGALILARFGFIAMALCAGALLLAVSTFLTLIRERPGERLLPWMAGHATRTRSNPPPESWSIVVRHLADAFRKRAAQRLLGLSLAIGLLVGLTGALVPVMMVRDFGWGQADYAQFRSTLKLVAGVAGMVFGGYAVDRLGHRLILCASLGGIALANIGLIVMFSRPAATAYIVAYEMLLVFTFVTFFAATMRQCSPAIAATQFSLTMVCGNLTMAAGAGMLGPLTAMGGLMAVPIALALVAIAGAVVIASIRFSAAASDLGAIGPSLPDSG